MLRDGLFYMPTTLDLFNHTSI